MKKTITRLTITTSLIFLAACGGGGGSDTAADGSLTIVNADGVNIAVSSTVLASGISTDCLKDGTGMDIIYTLKIVDSTYTWTAKEYAGDPTCTTLTKTDTVVASIAVVNNTKITKWNGGIAPIKMVGGALSDTASFTRLTTTITSSTNLNYGGVGLVYDQGFIIDNSVPRTMLIYNAIVDDVGGHLGLPLDPYVE